MTVGFHPRKRFGQHFLHDAGIVARIIAAFGPQPEDRAVEIGPGQGALTAKLLETLKTLHAVELDRDLAAHLQSRFTRGNLILHNADALKFDFCRLVESGSKLRVIGNLPYNISTPLLFHLLTQADCLSDILVMLQQEVAHRICAAAGSKEYGRLSVMIQWRCRIDKLFKVAASAFTPPPRVSSTMVRLCPYDTPPVPVVDSAVFERVVKNAFAHRRKTLRNTLKGLVSNEIMTTLDIDPGRRAETLSLEEFAALANAVSV